MDFELDEAQRDLLAAVRALMTAHAPDDYVGALDEASEFPHALYEQWARADLLGLALPEEYGGQGAGVLDFVLVVEEIARRGYDLALPYTAPIFNALNIVRHGTAEQRARWLPPFIDGTCRFSIAMTEPEAGSDAGAMRTSARREGDHYVLNGEKIFASGAGVPGTLIHLYARTDPDTAGNRGLSCFVVPNDTPGLTIRKVPTLGRRVFPTTGIVLDDVVVPAEAMLGEGNAGFTIMLSGLELERVAMAAAYVGNAQTVVDEALAYAKQREQFGSRIGDFQAIAHMLADMQTDVEAARLLTYRAAATVAAGRSDRRAVSMAKLFGSEAFKRVALQGLQIMGGYGYAMEMPMQRHVRAALGTTITAGTSQIQRQTIAATLGLRPHIGRAPTTERRSS